MGLRGGLSEIVRGGGWAGENPPGLYCSIPMLRRPSWSLSLSSLFTLFNHLLL